MPILVANNQGGAGSSRSWPLSDENAKAGNYPGRIVDAIHSEGIQETDFNDKSKTYEVDKVRFLVAYTDDGGEIVHSQTNEMTLSSNPKSNLIKFLTSVRGKQPPLDGTYDCFEVIGSTVSVTIQERTSQKGIEYGYVHQLTPLNKKLLDEAPELDEADIPGGRRTEIPEHIADQDETEEVPEDEDSVEEEEVKPVKKVRAKRTTKKATKKDPF